MQHDEAIQKLGEMTKDIQVAMMTTLMPDGTLRSRPMATQKTPFDGELWFFTDADSAKVHEVEGDHHVNLSYADPDNQRYVSVTGRASVVNDREKARAIWNPVNKAWFPNGVDDPALRLLRVKVDQAQYWDAPSGKMTQLIGLAKAV